jgi:hypothetical protein
MSKNYQSTMTNDALHAWAKNAQGDIDKLKEFVKIIATCPCCSRVDKCIPGCEFANGEHEMMELARSALKSTSTTVSE